MKLSRRVNVICTSCAGLSKGMRTPLKAPRQEPKPGPRQETTRKRKLWLECSPEDEVAGSQPSALSDGFNNGMH